MISAYAYYKGSIAKKRNNKNKINETKQMPCDVLITLLNKIKFGNYFIRTKKIKSLNT